MTLPGFVDVRVRIEVRAGSTAFHQFYFGGGSDLDQFKPGGRYLIFADSRRDRHLSEWLRGES